MSLTRVREHCGTNGEDEGDQINSSLEVSNRNMLRNQGSTLFVQVHDAYMMLPLTAGVK